VPDLTPLRDFLRQRKYQRQLENEQQTGQVLTYK
jgi:hypothetical protein